MELEMLEVVARTWLMDVLQNDGVKLALPVSDGETNMLASIESQSARGVWMPLRVIASYSVALPGRFEKVVTPGLLVAIVLDNVNPTISRSYRTFALTPAELAVVKLVALIARKGASRAASADASEQALQNALEPFVISPWQWRKKFITLLKDHSLSLA
jgi:hypothetical protein